jgi:hypothetical protein
VANLRAPTDEFAARVLASGMRAGQSLTIPGGMDLPLAHVFDDRTAALVVLIVALFEKDNSPRHGSIAVLRHMEQRAVAFVAGRLAECRDSSGRRVDLRNAYSAGLDLAGAETAALSIAERIKVGVSLRGFDDSLGLDFITFSGQALANRDVTFDLSNGDNRFSLSATLELSGVLPTLCSRESDAVAQAEAVVKGLQLRRLSLQKSLQTAAPQNKPALVDLINQITDVELPAAEAAVADARAALQACLDRFTGAPTLRPLNL